MPSSLEPSLFDERNSLFEEVFEDLLQTLGLGREQFENPSSLRSLAGPDLKGLYPVAQRMSLGGIFKRFTHQTVRAWDFLGEERKGLFFESRSLKISWIRILGKEFQYEYAEFAC